MLALALGLTLFSCQEGSDAGDLLGQWRQSGSDTKYVAFSGSVACFRCIGHGVVYGNFQHVGDSLFIQCHSISDDVKENDRQMIEQEDGFNPYTDIRVKIEAVDSDHLALSKNGTVWKFSKY